MHALTAALYRHLAGDPALAAMVSRHNNGPAVFSSRSVPPSAELPYVLIRPPASETAWDTLRRKGRSVILDIACFADARPGESSAQLDRLAERVRDLLHQAPLAVDGWHCASLVAIGPVDSPQEETGYAGRVVTLDARVQEDP